MSETMLLFEMLVNVPQAYVLRYLTKSSTDLDVIMKSGATVLLYELCFPNPHKRRIFFNYNIKDAVIHGHLSLVKSFYKWGQRSNDLLYHSASNGHLDIVMWMWEQFNNEISTIYFSLMNQAKELILVSAVANGHFSIVKWVYSIDHPKKLNGNSIGHACAGGHLQIARFLVAKYGFDKHFMMLCFEQASANGHVNILKWLLTIAKKYYPLNTIPAWQSAITVQHAAANGHLNAVVLLHSVGFACGYGVIDSAASNGHFDIVRWLHANGSICGPAAAAGAAAAGHLDILKWLFANCPEIWDTYHKQKEANIHYFMDNAVCNGHIDIVQWLSGQLADLWLRPYRPSSESWTMGRPAQFGHLKMLQWLDSHTDIQWTGLNMCHSAILGNQLPVLQWLHRNGPLDNGEQLLDSAIRHGRPEIAMWLRTVYTDINICKAAIMYCSQNRERKDIATFLKHSLAQQLKL